MYQHLPQYRFWRLHKVSLFFTRKYNSLKNRLSLSIYELSNLLFYVFLVLALLVSLHTPLFLYIVLGAAVVRIASLYVVMGVSAKKLDEKPVIPSLLFYDLLFSLLNPIYWLSAKIHHKKIAQR